ncbi:unnamed protein product [Urochloa humidicola]
MQWFPSSFSPLLPRSGVLAPLHPYAVATSQPCARTLHRRHSSPARGVFPLSSHAHHLLPAIRAPMPACNSSPANRARKGHIGPLISCANQSLPNRSRLHPSAPNLHSARHFHTHNLAPNQSPIPHQESRIELEKDPRLKQGVQQKKSKKALLTSKRSTDGPAMSSARTGVGAGGSSVAAVGALAGGSGAASAALPGGSGAASAALLGGSSVASDALDGSSVGDCFWVGTSGGDSE